MSKITTREQAVRRKLSHFFNGIPCKNGHLSRRATKSGACLACALDRTHRYMKNNYTDYRKRTNAYKHTLYRTSWRQRLAVLLRGASNRYGNTRGKPPHEVSSTIEDLLQQLEKQGYKDYYTGSPLELGTNNLFKSPSIDRLDSNKGYIEGNVVITTGVINRAKSDLTVEQFVELCGRIFQNFNSKSNTPLPYKQVPASV